MRKSMKKTFSKLLSVLLIFSFCFVVFTGCDSSRFLKKEAKKHNNYSIELAIDDKTMTATGREVVEYTNTTETQIDTLVFHLYPRAFRKDAKILPYTSLSKAKCYPNGESYGDIKINEVKENGGSAVTNIVGQDDDKLEVVLTRKLEPDDKCQIEILFDLMIPNCTHRFGYYNDNINLGNFYPILSVYKNGEYDLTPYYANGDPFYSDIASYHVNVSVGSEYSVYATGEKTSEQKNDKNTTVEYNALCVRDFAIVCGKNFEASSLYNKKQKTNVTYVGYNGDKKLEDCVKLANKAINYFSNTFTDYVYTNMVVVKTPFVHGGMEYPGVVFVSDVIEENEELYKVIVHEIAHQWWYGFVGVNEAIDAWIDEGLAEYSSALFFGSHPEYNITYNQMINDAITSYTLYVDVINSIDGKINTKMNLPVNEYLNEYEYTYMIYIKGLILFDELGQIAGQNKLIKALSKISKNYFFQNIDTDIFTEKIKHYLMRNTDAFFDNFLSGKVIIGQLH